MLLFSRDGLSWSMTDLTGMAPGDGAFLAGATVTDANVMLRYVSPTSGDPSEPLPDQRVLVGTLN